MTTARASKLPWRTLAAAATGVVTLWLYLFVSAPPLLASPASGPTIPIADVLGLLERENDVARALWTDEIVQRGGAVGLEFGERWRDAAVDAGPLPALFLRETARNLERTPAGLSLFLGSPYPVNTANRFTGAQAAHYAQLADTGAAQHFFEASTQRWTSMFSDVAVSDACVTCHNEHADSPKRDWRRGDVMGATTWMYPEGEVTAARALELIGTLRHGIRLAYRAYLEKAATFARRPAIGARWPCDGFALPSEDVFMAELARRSSATTLRALLEPGHDPEVAEPPRPRLACSSAPRPAAPVAELASAETSLLVVRTTRATRVTVEQGGRRLLLARLAPGGVTALSAPPPLRLVLAGGEGVTIEYRGQPVAVPTSSSTVTTLGVEVVVAASEDKS